MTIQIAIFSATGKMGKMVNQMALHDRRFSPPRLWDRSCTNPQELLLGCDVLIDFSLPHLTPLDVNLPLVIGTTGFSPHQLCAIERLSEKIPIFLASNFSLGIALLDAFCQNYKGLIDRHFTVALSERHHIHKKDAPSGTLKQLARHFHQPDISYQRLEEIVGEHSLCISNSLETLQISHTAHSREVFAQGALEAAFYLHKKAPGMYTMSNLLEELYAPPYLHPRPLCH